MVDVVVFMSKVAANAGMGDGRFSCALALRSWFKGKRMYAHAHVCVQNGHSEQPALKLRKKQDKIKFFDLFILYDKCRKHK